MSSTVVCMALLDWRNLMHDPESYGGYTAGGLWVVNEICKFIVLLPIVLVCGVVFVPLSLVFFLVGLLAGKRGCD